MLEAWYVFWSGGEEPGAHECAVSLRGTVETASPEKGLCRSAYNRMHMSKSIRLSEEAYDRLAAHKRDNETFSEVVLRLAGERSLLELAGILSDEQADALRDAVDERRERRDDDLEEIADQMREA